MENKTQLRAKIKHLESMFDMNEEWSELDGLQISHRLFRTIGMDITNALMKDRDFDGVVEFCKAYAERHKANAEWLLKKGECGLPLLSDEKVELAKYHIALSQIVIFG